MARVVRFVAVNIDANHNLRYCRVFNCLSGDLYKNMLADDIIRKQLLIDIDDNGTYARGYLNSEREIIWTLLLNLQKKLEESQLGYFMCDESALSSGVSF
jgi:hypothetical protein